MWRQACSFVACVAVSFEACCFVLRLYGGKLVVCIVPVWHQAYSFALRLCGSEKEKKTKEKKKFCCLCGCELKVTRRSFFGGVPSYFEALWYSHLYFYRKSNT